MKVINQCNVVSLDDLSVAAAVFVQFAASLYITTE
jgi:hypothetical protein